MTDAAIIRATFETYKHVPTRKALQIILEVPAEGQAAVFKALGYPDPQNSVWVAVARLVDGAVEPELIEEPEPEPHQIAGPPSDDDHRPPLRMSASAAIISKEGAFATFMRDKHGYSSQEPDEALKLFCGIDSKRELDDAINSSARSNFIALRNEYRAWLNCEEPV